MPAEVDVVLASLLAKSLVTADTGRGTRRYRLLDTTCAYLLGKLAEQDEGNRIARNHAIYYRELLERSDLVCGGPNSPAFFDAMQLDNVRIALEWSFSGHGDIELGTALAAASGPLLIGMSQLVEHVLDLSDRTVSPGFIDTHVTNCITSAKSQHLCPSVTYFRNSGYAQS